MPAKPLLAKIHIAKKGLGLDEETYRSCLENLTGKRSAKDLSDRELVRVIEHFKSKGWNPQARTPVPPTPVPPKKYDDLGPRDAYAATPPQLRMIEAMWHEISYSHEEVKSLRQFLFKTVKVSDLRFLDKKKAHDVIEAIKAIQKRNAGKMEKLRGQNATQ